MSDEQKEDMAYFQQMLQAGDKAQAVYVVNGNTDIDSSLEVSLRLAGTIEKMKENGTITDNGSCSHFLCSKTEQERRLKQWWKFASKYGQDIERLMADAAKASGFQDGTFDEFLDILKTDYEVREFTHFTPLTKTR
jgi:hypothetical protein